MVRVQHGKLIGIARVKLNYITLSVTIKQLDPLDTPNLNTIILALELLPLFEIIEPDALIGDPTDHQQIPGIHGDHHLLDLQCRQPLNPKLALFDFMVHNDTWVLAVLSQGD